MLQQLGVALVVRPAEALEVLTKQNRTVQTLFLGGNRISAAHGARIARLLQENPALSGLFLSVNSLQDEGVTALSQGLRTNESLVELSLASNGIGVAGCSELMQAIVAHPRLKLLDLGYSPSTRVLGAAANAIGDQGAMSIARFLEQNSMLQKLVLSRAGVGVAGVRALTDALVNNHSLCDLVLEDQTKAAGAELEALLRRNRNANGDRHPPSEDIARIRSVYR